MNLRDKINQCITQLAAVYDSREARNILELAIEHLKGWNKVDILMNSDKEVSDFISGKIDAIVDRLLRHEPIQYILGETYWHGLKLKVAPGVLIPRPETSQLVDIITDDNHASDLNVLDICTGSGAIAVALSRNLDFPDVTALDISKEALGIAEENDRDLHTVVKFIMADILKPLPFDNGSFDIIVSNPPYICESERQGMSANVLDYEPSIALFVPDSDPLKFYRPIAAEGHRIARDGGRLYLEINPAHADALKSLLVSEGWTDVTILNDITGRRRFIKAVKGE